MTMNKVGIIRFDGHVLDVYGDLNEPYFMAVEVAKLIDYSTGRTADMLNLVEQDEKVLIKTRESLSRRDRRAAERKAKKVTGTVGTITGTGQNDGNPTKWFVTELGLYNILSQSRKPIARKWRRVVHSNLIMMRKQQELTIAGQFDEWDALADDLYIDSETGILMQSVTVAGGDVEQVPYEG